MTSSTRSWPDSYTSTGFTAARVGGHRATAYAVALHTVFDAVCRDGQVAVAAPAGGDVPNPTGRTGPAPAPRGTTRTGPTAIDPTGVELTRIDLTRLDPETATLADLAALLSGSPPALAPGAGPEPSHLVSTLAERDHNDLMARLRPATALHIDEAGARVTLSVAAGEDTQGLPALVERAWALVTADSAGEELPLQDLLAPCATRPIPIAPDEPPLFIARFSAVCAEHPGRVAVSEADGVTTYRELERMADLVAAQFEERGLGAGSRIVLVPNRDRVLVVAVVAAYKVGATVSVLNPALPLDHLEHCVGLAGADLVLDLAGTGVRGAVTTLTTQGTPAARFHDDRLGPDDPAVLTFTSGTTGSPKAVLGRYGSLTYFFDWMDRVLGPLAGARFGMCSSIGHDPLQRDIMTPLYLGGTICVPKERDLTDPVALPRWLAAAGVAVICVNPAATALLTGGGPGTLTGLRRVFFVGSALTREQARGLMLAAPGAELVNLYGSTETQRAVGFFRLPAADRLDLLPAVVPVGTGMKDAELLVLTPGGRRCLPLQRGQIAVRSPYVGLGYAGDPALTEARFRRDVPAGEAGVPLYLTGDIGYISPRHGVVFAGREDAQIKINGHRVELTEISEACRRHPLVHDAACVVVDVDGHPTIVSFLVPIDDTIRFEPERFRAALGATRPTHLLPHQVRTVPTLPLTANGKLDQAQLVALAHAPGGEGRGGDTGGDEPPSTPGPERHAEILLGEFVRRHTGLDRFPMDVPLTALGVDSLRFVSLVSRLGSGWRTRYGSRLTHTMTAAELIAATSMEPDEDAPLSGSGSVVAAAAFPSTYAPARPPEQSLIAPPAEVSVAPYAKTPGGRSGPQRVRTASKVTETTVEVDGRHLEHLCSNSYLGLGGDAGIRRRVAAFVNSATSLAPHGSSAINGHSQEHERLATLLRRIFRAEAVTLFSSGYLANASAIPLVAGPGGTVFVDERSHRSVLDGCVLSGAVLHVYRHQDVEDLAAQLKAHAPGPGSVITAEALSGSTGGIADLPGLASCARDFGCTLYVDEASSLGQIGPTGRGIEEHFGMTGCIDVRVGSLGKALASSGGFVTCGGRLAERLRGDRGAVFSTPISPIGAFVAAEAAATLLRDGAGLVGRLRRNGDRWREALHAEGFGTGASAAAIVPLGAGGDDAADRWFSAALDAGLLTVPLSGTWGTGIGALRTAVTAAHDPDGFPALARRLRAAAAAAGIAPPTDRNHDG
ncbi:amino acid adenylation domain-containing protein [Actinacidiphila yanglinensis]|uniref:Amino acid adenylation domain-containing protein n=1 Tax=Actinacidiphila yanglinensis TaxID=310779 RepID=A0A1H6DH32_9ACTN|nr:aminotransferase class I/II-fold pyridoxal phosphate-dependent enzyme [Actinacidiphila yanglinensis]SEG84510.1 amino acid adenylation domain-containing protein [Actinacidiphila yanglinensis]